MRLKEPRHQTGASSLSLPVVNWSISKDTNKTS